MGPFRFEFPANYDLAATLGGPKRATLLGPSVGHWSTNTVEGPGTLHLSRASSNSVEATSWGPGGKWLMDQVPALLGRFDNPDSFSPPPALRNNWKRKRFRLCQTGVLWEAIVGAVLSQKVQTTKAARAINQLAFRYGNPAPGPSKTNVLPTPPQVAAMSYSDFHSSGVDRKRADTIIRCAKHMTFLLNDQPKGIGTLSKRLGSIKGIGPWTVAMVEVSVFGNPDAVPLGDFHIPNTVGWHLANKPRSTDEQMMQLLAPYTGHRWRIIRLAESASHAPRYAQRLSLKDDGLYRAR